MDEVWVDQKTLTISLRPGCWMNPHSLDCYSKMLNTDQLIRGRQGLIPITDVITHIVQREDMVLNFLFFSFLYLHCSCVFSSVRITKQSFLLYFFYQTLLMNPMLQHSDPMCRDILSESRVGFRLEIANFVRTVL